MIARLFASAARAAGLLVLASVAVFGATELLPSDAARTRSGGTAAAGLRDRLGLDRPAWRRYADWLAGLARGDAGDSCSPTAPWRRWSPSDCPPRSPWRDARSP